MSIQVLEAPPAQPVALSDCFYWKLQPQPSDMFTTVGSKATVVLTFNANPSAPADGTQFTLWGQTLEVQSAQDSTPYSFKVYSGDANATINAFYAMLLSNYIFINATTVEVDYTTNTINITWNDCGEQPNFAAAQMNFAPLSSVLSANVNNGTTPVLRDNFKVLLRLWRNDIVGSNGGFVTAFEAVSPQGACSTPNVITFDAMPIARQMLMTRIPQIDSNAHPTVGHDGPLQYFALFHGYTYNDGAEVRSGEFTSTVPRAVLNAYFEPNDAYKMRRFWPGAAGGYPPFQTHRKWLTSKPLYHHILRTSRAWMWYMVNEAIETIGTLEARFVVDLGTSTPVHDVVVPNSQYGVNAVNVSPAYVASLIGQPVESIKSYFVTVRNNGVQITEATNFTMVDECKPTAYTDVYFLGKYGGIETMAVEIIEEGVSQDAEEALTSIACGAGRFNLAAYGGRTLTGVRSFQTFKLRALDNRPVALEFFRHMRASPQRWIRMTDDAGKPIAWKLLVDTGSITIKEAGGSVELLFSGKLNDAPIQRGNEPEF